jgi:hypothetical protein
LKNLQGFSRKHKIFLFILSSLLKYTIFLGDFNEESSRLRPENHEFRTNKIRTFQLIASLHESDFLKVKFQKLSADLFV